MHRLITASTPADRWKLASLKLARAARKAATALKDFAAVAPRNLDEAKD